jgi:hypothetical protein
LWEGLQKHEQNGTWGASVQYKLGDMVVYNGKKYKCRIPHTSIVTWEPSITLALWEPM